MLAILTIIIDDETEKIKARNIAANKVCKLYLDKKSTKIVKYDYARLYKSTVLWKCNMNRNTNDRTNVMSIGKGNVKKNLCPNAR